MADIFSKDKRSQIMASISGKETTPEVAVRSFLFRQGFRFRKNAKQLPGKPDVVLPKFKTVIFIHGCFWHGHQECKRASIPKTNETFWTEKIRRNAERDKKNCLELRNIGWRVITIWQCEIKNQQVFKSKMYSLIRFLSL